MERLTDKEIVKKLKEGYFGDIDKWEQAYLRLAEYEDGLEDGKYIKPHCKVGDIVYRICSFINSKDKFVMPAKIASIEVFADGVLYRTYNDYGFTEYLIGDRFNDSWFLTREEAEKRLEELKG